MRNPFDLTDKVAIVTGGNGGLGLGMALGLARAGATIVIAARDGEKSGLAAEQIAVETGVTTMVVRADVAEPDDTRQVAEMVERAFGRIDILVNNAGITVRKRPEDFTLEEWQSVLNVNLNGVLLMCQAAYPLMKRQGGGKIINIGSMASLFGASYAAPYAASKGAVVQLTKSLALAWAADNIQVNAILPGWFETDMTDGARAYVAGLYERVLSRSPTGRWGKPEDIAGAAVWLAGSASDFVTGVALPVDGGYKLRGPAREDLLNLLWDRMNRLVGWAAYSRPTTQASAGGPRVRDFTLRGLPVLHRPSVSDHQPGGRQGRSLDEFTKPRYLDSRTVRSARPRRCSVASRGDRPIPKINLPCGASSALSSGFGLGSTFVFGPAVSAGPPISRPSASTLGNRLILQTPFREAEEGEWRRTVSPPAEMAARQVHMAAEGPAQRLPPSRFRPADVLMGCVDRLRDRAQSLVWKGTFTPARGCA